MFNRTSVRLAIVSVASTTVLLPGAGAVAETSKSPTASPMVREIGPWVVSTTRDSTDGDPGGVSGTARLQRFNTASPSGIEFAEIAFTAAGELVKVRNKSPWNADWYLLKNGVVRNSGTVKSGGVIDENFNILEGEDIGIMVCLYWAGGSKCAANYTLKS